MVVVHKDKLETELAQRFRKDGFKAGDTGYFVIGTVHKDQVKRFKAYVAPIQCLKWRWFP